MARWQRLVVLCAAIIILMGAGIFAYDRYSDWHTQQLAEKAALKDTKKTVAEQSAGTEYFLTATYDDSDMTYAQLFDRADDRSKKITDAIVSIKASDLPDEQKASAVTYLESLGQTLDALEMQYRKSLNSSNSVESMKSAQADYLSTPYNEYSDSWERKRVSDAAEEATKALSDFKDSIRSFNRSLKGLRKTEQDTQTKLNGFSLVDEKVLTKAIAKSDEDLKTVQ